MIENKITDEITSVVKTKSNKKKDETKKDKKFAYHQKKDSKLLMT